MKNILFLTILFFSITLNTLYSKSEEYYYIPDIEKTKHLPIDKIPKYIAGYCYHRYHQISS